MGSKKLNDVSFIRVFEAIIRRIISVHHYTAWLLPTSFSQNNKKRLASFKNIHAGKRCFIIANGPSLSKINFELLKGEITIGMNRIYLLNEKIGFMPNYLVVSDIPIQLKQFTEEYNDVKTTKFYHWWCRNIFKDKNGINFFYQHFKKDFQPEFTKTIGASKSVTYVCIQLAFYMGFKDVYIIGKDHSYDVTGKAGNTIQSDGKEKNHFIDNYYKIGQKWKVPNYIEEEYTYAVAREEYEKNGVNIKDATVDGKLEVFEKVDFYSLFDKSQGE